MTGYCRLVSCCLSRWVCRSTYPINLRNGLRFQVRFNCVGVTLSKSTSVGLEWNHKTCTSAGCSYLRVFLTHTPLSPLSFTYLGFLCSVSERWAAGRSSNFVIPSRPVLAKFDGNYTWNLRRGPPQLKIAPFLRLMG